MVLKVEIKGHVGPDDVTDVPYDGTKTIRDVRDFAAEKLGMEARKLKIRTRGYGGGLPLEKTFEELKMIEDGAVLCVEQKTYNLAKHSEGKIRRGENTTSTKHDVDQLMLQGKRHHDENLRHL